MYLFGHSLAAAVFLVLGSSEAVGVGSTETVFETIGPPPEFFFKQRRCHLLYPGAV